MLRHFAGLGKMVYSLAASIALKGFRNGIQNVGCRCSSQERAINETQDGSTRIGSRVDHLVRTRTRRRRRGRRVGRRLGRRLIRRLDRNVWLIGFALVMGLSILGSAFFVLP
jgi:hypothetical protein